MWMPRLADMLVENGVEQFLNLAKEAAGHSRDKIERDHWHFLISGLKSINRDELAATVEPLKAYPSRLRKLDARWAEHLDALKDAEAKWDIAAANAKEQILVWGNWASSMEVAAYKRAFRWLREDRMLGFGMGSKFRGAAGVLRSSQNLAANMNFFNETVALITAVIERSYVDGDFDVVLSPADLEEAVRALLDQQLERNKRDALVEEAKDEWESLSSSYLDHRSPLLRLLWLMPKSAHMALFWLFRPELEYRSLQST